jgi:large subunit ribosomal protein L24
MKSSIKKGDNVIVLTGDDKGKSGRVTEVIREKSRVIVDGVNMHSRHTKPNAKNPNGGIIKAESTIHISNVAIVDPKSGKATRVGKKEEKGVNVRYAKKSGAIL